MISNKSKRVIKKISSFCRETQNGEVNVVTDIWEDIKTMQKHNKSGKGFR